MLKSEMGKQKNRAQAADMICLAGEIDAELLQQAVVVCSNTAGGGGGWSAAQQIIQV